MVLQAIADMDVGGRSFAIQNGQLHDRFGRHAGNLRYALRRILLHVLAQLGMAKRIAFQERFIHQAALEQHVHHSERQRAVRAGIQRDEPVGPLTRPVAVHVDDDELRALFAGFFDQGDLMHVRADEIAAPHDNQLRLDRVFRARPAAESHRISPTRVARGIAYALLQLRRAQSVEEPPVHAVDA
ncbi:hypothetical protein D3C76_1327420 [compost metagenome]